MATTEYRTISGNSNCYYGLLAVLGAVIGVGLFCAHFMEVEGHHVTGMTNRIVWGLPHVVAIFLIVAASGALNVASIASVFGKAEYKPLSRLSGLIAIALLAGGLVILVLDLGRPDRLIVAMTHYNFKSIFAWNIFLYNGFFVIVAIYLWMSFERRFNKYSPQVGTIAFIWRLILTTGTGSIFGFLVARQAYDAALMAPMFVIMSFSFGTAAFILILMSAYAGTSRVLGIQTIKRLAKLLGVFVAAVLYFNLAYHLTNLYAAEHHSVERFLLLDGGMYTELFWFVQLAIGSLAPMAIFFTSPLNENKSMVALGCVLVIIGGLSQLYIIVIGGQAFPLVIFPGMEVSSNFFDGTIAPYTPSVPELGLAVGGVALALIMVTLAIKFLPFLPESLADKVDEAATA